MTEAKQQRQSFFMRIENWIGSIVDWSNAEKCVLGSALTLSIATPFMAWLYYGVKHPELTSYFDHGYLKSILPFLIPVYVGGWLAMLLVSLWARRHAPDSRLLVHAVVQFYFVTITFSVYVFGMYTTNQILMVVGGFCVGCLLFEKGPMRAGIVSLALMYAGATLAEQAGLIPYAPFMAGEPYVQGQLEFSWLASYGALSTWTLALVMMLVYFIFYRWRERERELAIATDQLSRANELISRYVAAQVSERILSGDYEAVNKHARLKLTVFFSDIKNFTSTTDRMEAEDLSEILNEYLTEMTIIADKHGGTIDKFVGDAIMIFFGAPDVTSDRDHALRAVRMAIEMQERMEVLREEWQKRGVLSPFHIRMGINTGHASIGNFGSEGRMDYTAIGRQVNLAARLEVNCEPDRILISHATWALVNEEITCTPKGEITAKGVRDPVQVYEVA